MSAGEAVPKRRGDFVATIPLLVGHCLLVLYTMVASAGVLRMEVESEDRCRSHDLDCTNSWVQIGGWTALCVSAILLIADIGMVIRRRSQRRLTFVTPLLCCIAQVMVVGGLAAASQ